MKSEFEIKNDKAMLKYGITKGMTVSCPANGMVAMVESVRFVDGGYSIKVEGQPEVLLLQLVELFENGTLKLAK